jgi:hypothetical protein
LKALSHHDGAHSRSDSCLGRHGHESKCHRQPERGECEEGDAVHHRVDVGAGGAERERGGDESSSTQHEHDDNHELRDTDGSKDLGQAPKPRRGRRPQEPCEREWDEGGRDQDERAPDGELEPEHERC